MHERFMTIEDEEALRARVRRAVGGVHTDPRLSAILDGKEVAAHVEEQEEIVPTRHQEEEVQLVDGTSRQEEEVQVAVDVIGQGGLASASRVSRSESIEAEGREQPAANVEESADAGNADVEATATEILADEAIDQANTRRKRKVRDGDSSNGRSVGADVSLESGHPSRGGGATGAGDNENAESMQHPDEPTLDDPLCEKKARYDGVHEIVAGEGMSTRILSSQRSAILDDSRCENQARYEGVAEIRRRYVD